MIHDLLSLSQQHLFFLMAQDNFFSLMLARFAAAGGSARTTQRAGEVAAPAGDTRAQTRAADLVADFARVPGDALCSYTKDYLLLDMGRLAPATKGPEVLNKRYVLLTVFLAILVQLRATVELDAKVRSVP